MIVIKKNYILLVHFDIIIGSSQRYIYLNNVSIFWLHMSQKEVGVPFSLYFKAPWNEDMFLEAGDYLVKDGNNGLHRVTSI